MKIDNGFFSQGTGTVERQCDRFMRVRYQRAPAERNPVRLQIQFMYKCIYRRIWAGMQK